MNLKIHTLSIKYLLSFLLLVIAPVFIFTFITSVTYSRYQSDLTKIQMQETVNQIASNLNNEIASVSILSSALIHNDNFKVVCDLYDSAVDPQDIYRQSEALDLELSRLFLYTSKVGIVFVYTRNKPVFLFRNFPMIANLPENPLPDERLLKSVEETRGVVHISDDFFNIYRNSPGESEDPLLYLAVHPGPTENGLSIEKVLFAYKIKILNKIYSSSSLQQFSYLTDAEGNVILAPQGNSMVDSLENPESNGKTDRSRWLVLTSTIESTDWTLHHVIDIHAFLQPFYRIRRFFYLIFAVLFIFFILYTFFFFHNMISPLNMLIEKMQLVEKGDYAVRVQVPDQPELNHLFHSFNRMINQVRELTEKQTSIDREKSLLELQALQYQINPHFVANTLNAIRLMAVVKKNENIKNMTSSLMQIINDSFRGEGNKTTLQEEMKSLESYVHIMKVRFSTPIELRFSIAPELASYSILKMLLQPIIENSIIHGFSRKKGKGYILIQIHAIGKEKKLLLRICDNGCGVDLKENPFPVKPDSSPAGTLTRIGIYNVNRRIKLNYGEEYGLLMRSRPDFYTRTDIYLPLNKEISDVIPDDRR